MTLSQKHSFSTMLLALALIATASQAGAQIMYQGKVDLPFETHWASAVFQPGPHTISIESASTGVQLIHVTGQEGRKTILAIVAERQPTSGKGSLSLVNVNGSYAVKRFEAGFIGTTFDFAVPKAKGSQDERAETVLNFAGTQ